METKEYNEFILLIKVRELIRRTENAFRGRCNEDFGGLIDVEVLGSEDSGEVVWIEGFGDGCVLDAGIKKQWTKLVWLEQDEKLWSGR